MQSSHDGANPEMFVGCLMRAFLAKVVLAVAVLAGLAAACSWAYFIWSFDWGHSYRGRGLWMMLLSFPAILIFLGVAIGLFMVLHMAWEFILREEFPPL
jgi:hypothetical protein